MKKQWKLMVQTADSETDRNDETSYSQELQTAQCLRVPPIRDPAEGTKQFPPFTIFLSSAYNLEFLTMTPWIRAKGRSLTIHLSDSYHCVLFIRSQWFIFRYGKNSTVHVTSVGIHNLNVVWSSDNAVNHVNCFFFISLFFSCGQMYRLLAENVYPIK